MKSSRAQELNIWLKKKLIYTPGIVSVCFSFRMMAVNHPQTKNNVLGSFASISRLLYCRIGDRVKLPDLFKGPTLTLQCQGNQLRQSMDLSEAFSTTTDTWTRTSQSRWIYSEPVRAGLGTHGDASSAAGNALEFSVAILRWFPMDIGYMHMQVQWMCEQQT